MSNRRKRVIAFGAGVLARPFRASAQQQGKVLAHRIHLGTVTGAGGQIDIDKILRGLTTTTWSETIRALEMH